MRIIYVLKNELPPLAWVAHSSNGVIEVLHGNRVECTDSFFVEGAWDGGFKLGNFESADWFCGTGGHVYEDKVIFSTPTHVISGLYLVKESGGGYCISNSLYLLMALNRYRLDPQYLNYEIDFNSITKGVYKYKQNIHALDTEGEIQKVKILYFRNITIWGNNRVDIEVKPSVDPFKDYNDYYTRLTSAISRMCSNAQEASRKYRYGLVTMISKGYDAPCCAAIAKMSGCDTALTFKAVGHYADDSGVEIAKKLGYSNIIEKDAMEYKTRKDLVEAEYLCSGELGAEISFSAFDDYYEGNLVFSGERGDSIWDKNSLHRNSEFHFINMQSGLSAAERRLWKGYVSVPMALFGGTAWRSIFDISNSDEMKPWRMNNLYDRPIPRRIIEESGVPREYFGMEKRGAGFSYHYDWAARIKKRMSNTSAESFERYLKENKRFDINAFVKFIWNTRDVYFSRLGISKKLDIEKLSQIANPTATRYLIPWAGDHILQKYRKILEE